MGQKVKESRSHDDRYCAGKSSRASIRILAQVKIEFYVFVATYLHFSVSNFIVVGSGQVLISSAYVDICMLRMHCTRA